MSAGAHPDWDRDGHDWPNRSASTFRLVGSVAWHVQRIGSGPTMVLLHGAGAATHSWRDLLPLLAERYDVIAPDLPGHGFTRAPSGQHLTLTGMAEALGALLRDLDIDPVALVGHSAGGAIAIEMALSGHAEPDVLIGLNAALTPFRGIAGVLFPPMAKLLALNPATPWLFTRLAGRREQARRLIGGTGSEIDPEGLALYSRLFRRTDHVGGALTMMANWDLEPMLARLDQLAVPLHLIVGARDKAVPPGEARRIAVRMDRVTLREIPDLGHLMHEERPAEIAGLVRQIVG